MRYQRGALPTIVLFIAAACPILAMQQRGREPGITRTRPSSSGTDLGTITRDLRDKSQDAWNAVINQRAKCPVELYVALAGFASSASAYWQMAADAREDSNLRNAARKIVATASEIDSLLASAAIPGLIEAWRIVQTHVAALSNTYNLGYTVRGRYPSPNSRRVADTAQPDSASSGRLRWRGRVDGSDYIMLQGNQVTIRHLEFNPITEASYELPTPLPQMPVQVRLNKIKGRGQVEIVRQPSTENNYTVTVLVEDTPGGNDFYEFELFW